MNGVRVPSGHTAGSRQGEMNVVRLLNVLNEERGILILVWELVKGVDVLDYLNRRGVRIAREPFTLGMFDPCVFDDLASYS